MATQTITKWKIDPTHSEVEFKVKHLVISTITGKFKEFSGTVESNADDFTDAEVSFVLKTASIDTNQAERDTHLKSPDFFDVQKFPEVTFKSSSMKKEGNNKYKLTGQLTVKGTTQPIVLDAEYGGTATDYEGNQKVGFEITGKFNRKDYGLNWDGITQAGSIVVGNEVRLSINIELVKNSK
jgi:polyisoprenoid-binding protein YceI